MDGIVQDLKFSLRSLTRAPGFALGAIATLALGIAANAAVFPLVHGLLFQSPPGVTDPDRLVQIARSYESEARWDNFSWPALQLIGREATTLAGVAATRDGAFVLGQGQDVEQVAGQYVTGSYFSLLGLTPALGRLLYPSDDETPGAHAVVVLSHTLWTRRFGADPNVVGRTLSLGAHPYEIVGVAPPQFRGTNLLGGAPALWVPTMQLPAQRGVTPFDQWGWSSLDVIGRLQEGVTFTTARAAMDVVSARLRAADSVNEDMVVLLAEGIGLDPQERAEATRISLILMLIVGVLLLITCSNVANLSLARATTRSAEIGMRLALGAGRRRVARQLLTESMVLGLAATVLAAPLLLAAGRLVPWLLPVPLSGPIQVGRTSFLFLAAVGILAGLLFGLAPAWSGARRDLAATFREAGATTGRRRMRMRDALVVAQLGLSLGLVSAAALLGRSARNAHAADPGFQPDGLTSALVYLDPTGRYDAESGPSLYQRLTDAVEALPGVERVTMANQTPIAGGHSRSTVRPEYDESVEYEAESIVVTGEYFETLEIRLLSGRNLRGIGEEPEPVVVINESLARLFWPDQNPVGQRLAGDPAMTVVGVVADVQMRSLRAPARPAVYYPSDLRYSALMVLHIRSVPGQPLSAAALRAAVASVDPALPLPRVDDLRTAVAASMEETRTIGRLVAVFAILALLLAAVGLYGLVAYSASQRTREIGIRTALGAEPGSLLRMILSRGLGLTGVGIAVGLAVSWGIGQALQSLLFGVRASDVPTLGAAAAALMATALLAAWIPARRASRVDAAVTLRD